MIKNVEEEIICNEFGLKIYQKLIKIYPELSIENFNFNESSQIFSNNSYNNNINNSRIRIIHQNKTKLTQFDSRAKNL